MPPWKAGVCAPAGVCAYQQPSQLWVRMRLGLPVKKPEKLVASQAEHDPGGLAPPVKEPEKLAVARATCNFGQSSPTAPTAWAHGPAPINQPRRTPALPRPRLAQPPKGRISGEGRAEPKGYLKTGCASVKAGIWRVAG